MAHQPALPSDEDEPPELNESGRPKKRRSKVSEELIGEEVNNQRANRELRATYADKAHELAQGCICFWIIVVSTNGIINGATGKLMINDSVMIAITTGVTINVLAAFLGVIRGLFPTGRQKNVTKNKRKRASRRS